MKLFSKTFEGIKNVTSFHDDILVWGDTQESVRNTSHLVLEQASKQGIKFNPTKCEFCLHGIEFLGHVFSNNGVSMSSDKVRAVLELP